MSQQQKNKFNNQQSTNNQAKEPLKATIQEKLEEKLEKKAEKTIENEILHALNEMQNCFAFKVNTTGVLDGGQYRQLSKFVQAGTSDIICCINGKFVAIEVKKQNGILSPQQQAFQTKIRKVGGAVITARNVEDAVRNVKHFDKTGVCVVS